MSEDALVKNRIYAPNDFPSAQPKTPIRRRP